MNEAKYILEIVLKARNQMAAAMNAARTEINRFGGDIKKFDKEVEALNNRITSLNTRVGNVTDKISEWRAVMQGFGKDSDEAGKSTGRLAKETDDLVKKTEVAVERHKDLAKATEDLGKKFLEVDRDFRAGKVTREDYVSDLKLIGAEYDKLSKKAEIGSELGRSLRSAGAVAKQQIQEFQNADKARAQADADAIKREVENTRQIATLKEQALKEENTQRRNQSLFILDLLKTVSDREVQVSRNITAINKAEADERIRLANNRVAAELDAEKQIEKAAGVAAKEAEKAAKVADVAAKKQFDASQRQLELETRANAARKRLGQADAGFVAGDPDTQRASLRSLAQEFDSLSRATERGSQEQIRFATEAEHARNILRDYNQTTVETSRDNDRSSSVWQNLSQQLNNSSDSVASLDNRVRGIGLLLMVGFAQQLITTLGGLAGSLFSVASSAAFAGAALAGMAAAGIGQALPVIGLLTAAFQRVGGVMDAFKQAQQLQQQQFVQGARDTQNAADNSDRLAAANERLQQTQQDLNDAREQAVRDLEDLVLAERKAELAARGAALTQREAEEARRRAVLSGDTSGLARTELGVLDAQVNREEQLLKLRRQRVDTRTAVRGGVEEMPAVVGAGQQVKEAERALTSATRTAEEASRAMVTAQANLDYLLSQLSPAERRLFESLNQVYLTYRRVFIGDGGSGSGILGVIIDSFTRAVDRVNEIIQMPKVIATIQGLAKEISTQFDNIFDAFTSGPMIDQFLRIADAGRENLGPITDIIISIGEALVNIAEAAGPAFSKFIDFVGGLADEFLGLTDKKDTLEDFFLTGERHLEAWINLGLSIIGLFLALAGAGGAQSGLGTVEDATTAIDDLTKKVDDNKGKVAEFFEDARDIAKEFVGVIADIAEELGVSFDVESVKDFADLLKETVIPAVGEVIRALGRISTRISNLFSDHPVAADIAKWGIAFAILATIAGSVTGAILQVAKVVRLLVTPILGLGRTVLEKVVPAFEKLKPLLGFQSGEAAGPKILGLAAKFTLVAGVVAFVLDKLGLLDEAFDAVAGFFTEMWAQIEPPLGRLRESLGRLFDAISNGSGAFGPIIDTIRFFAGILIWIADVVLAALGKAVGQVFGGLIDIIGGAIDILTGILTGDFGLMWEGFKDILLGAGNLIIGLLTLVLFRGLGGIFKGLIGLIKGAVIGIGRAFANLGRTAAFRFIELVERLIPMLIRFFRNLPKNLAGIASSLFTWFRNAGSNAATVLREGLESIFGFIRRMPRRIAGLMVAVAGAFVGAFTDVGGNILKAMFNGVEGAAGFAKDIVNGLIGLIEDAVNNGFPDKIGFVSVPDIHLPRFAKGGPVPGYGGGDIYKAALEPGEHVVTKEEVRKAGGHQIIFALRAMLGGGGQGGPRGYADGGAVAPNAGVASLVVDFSGASLEEFRTTWRDFWRNLVSNTRQGSKDIEDRSRLLLTRLTNIFDNIGDRFDRLADRLGKSTVEIKDTIFEGMSYIARATNRGLQALDSDPVKFNIPTPGKDRKATGGVVGQWGQRGLDTVATWLGKGEAVLNHWQQRAINSLLPGQNTVQTVLDRMRGFHAGGPEQPGYAQGRPGVQQNLFDGHPSNVDPAVRRIVELLKKKFPLTVTSTTDHSRLTASGNVSDHTLGRAVDVSSTPSVMDKAASFVLSSGLAKRLKQAIYSGTPTLAWSGGENVGPGYFGPDVMGMHANHLHLAASGVLKGVFSSFQKIAKLMVKGTPGPLRTLIQSALEQVRGAANKKLRKDSSQVEMHDFDAPESASAAANISLGKRMSSAFGWAGRQWNALRELWTGESGWRETIANYEGSGAYGIPQALPGDKMATEGADWRTNPVTQIRWGLKYIKERYGDPIQALQFWQAQSPHWYAQGGVVPGGDGTPVGVVAHAGEWILNKFQQSRLAQLLGTGRDALGSLLGFHGSSERGFQGGGEVSTRQKKIDRIMDVEFSDDTFRGFEALLNDVSDIFKRAIRLRKVTDSVKKFSDLFENLTAPDTGILDRLRAAIERRANVATRRLTESRFNVREEVIPGPASGLSSLIKNPYIRGAVQGAQRIASGTKKTTVVEQMDEVQVAAQELKNQLAQRIDLTKERDDIREALEAVRKRQGEKGLTKEQKRKLKTQENDMRTRLDDSRQRVADNVEAIFNAQENALQTRIAAQEKIVEDITKGFDRTKSLGDLWKRIAGALGDEGSVAKINEAQRVQLLEQANALEARIGPAMAAGANDLANDLILQVAELRVSAFEALQQSIRDAAESVNNQAQKVFSRQDVAKRILTALGQSTTGIDQARIDALRKQQADLEAVAQRAAAAGNAALAEEIRDQIGEIGASIIEATQEMTQAAISEVNTQAQRRIGRLDLGARMLEATGSVGLTAGAVVGGETFSRSSIFASRGQALQTQRGGLQEILRAQQQLPIAEQNLDVIRDLTDQILELDVTIAENTRAAFSARVEDVNRVADFGLSVNDLLRQIVELEGEISGNTDQATLLASAQERQSILLTQRSGLEQLLAEAQAANDQQAVNDLTVAILQNRVAVLNNTKIINDLNGTMTNPQTFTSSAWTLFREAIFDGMGKILPQYDVFGDIPVAATGGIARKAGLYHLEPGELYRPGNWENNTSSRGGDNIFHIYEAGQPIDKTELAGIVTFARKTDQ